MVSGLGLPNIPVLVVRLCLVVQGSIHCITSRISLCMCAIPLLIAATVETLDLILLVCVSSTASFLTFIFRYTQILHVNITTVYI